MTNNQLTYQRNLETERANRAAEAHNVRSLAEVVRHNQASEGISWNSLAENIRHNKSSENISLRNLLLGYDQLAETHRYNSELMRHNRFGEGISLRQLSESIRHNQASEFNGADRLHLLLNPSWSRQAYDAYADVFNWNTGYDDKVFSTDSPAYENRMQEWQNYLDFIRSIIPTHQGSSGQYHNGSGSNWSWPHNGGGGDW